MNKVISCTSRSPRKGESDGFDYRFKTVEEFAELKEKGEFVETAVYNEWNYGMLKSDLKDNSVIVMTPSGLRKLIKYNESLECPFDIVSFYISVDQRSRLIKLLQRGDDIMEAIRRSLSDLGQFDDIGDETTYIVRNEEYRFTPEQMLIHVEQALEDYHLNLLHKTYGESNGSI